MKDAPAHPDERDKRLIRKISLKKQELFLYKPLIPLLSRFLLLGILIQPHEINRLHQKGNKAAIHGHLTDNLPGKGEEQGGTVHTQHHIHMFFRDILQ